MISSNVSSASHRLISSAEKDSVAWSCSPHFSVATKENYCLQMPEIVLHLLLEILKLIGIFPS